MTTSADGPVFVSYHDADLAVVERLDADLRKRGVTAFIGARSVPPGQSKTSTIESKIVESTYVIVCLSPEYLNDKFARTQLFIARAYGKRILPILVGDFPERPLAVLREAGDTYPHAIKGIEELDIADFGGHYPRLGLGSYEKNFERLVDVIRPVPKPTPLNSVPIYVSYNFNHTEFATRIARDLELARGRVWIDKLSIQIGANWRAAMYEGLRTAGHFVVCLNTDAARSENVNHEVLVAAMRGIPIHPVVSDNTPSAAAELDRELRESREMRFLADVQPFAPYPSYETMLEALKQAVGLGADRPPTKSGVFISYRRADSQAVTGRMRERLVREFGADNVFVDVDTIPAGADFSAYYKKWIQDNAAVVLVIIGKSWSSIQDEKNPKGPRIREDGDHVRIEVAEALGLERLTVLPVLVDDAEMPKASDLPDNLHRLTTLNGVKVRHDPDFDHDMG